MTTNVPQDVIDQLRLDVGHNRCTVSTATALANLVEAYELLRAQRQQGAEPVAWWGIVDVEDNRLLETFPDESAANKTLEILNKLVGAPLRKVIPVYTTPPQANALVAAFGRRAAEIVRQDESGRDSSGYFADEILAAIPADAEAALREVCIEWVKPSDRLPESIEPHKPQSRSRDVLAARLTHGKWYYTVEEVVWRGLVPDYWADIPAPIVNSVLGEGGK
jgi:hypothetical protein